MSLIIAGRFDTFEKAELTSESLKSAGFLSDDLSVVYVSSPVQHARAPIGGDAMTDRGSKHVSKGAGKGVAFGVILGAVVGVGIFYAFSAPLIVTAIAAAIGGYVGSLAGGMVQARRSKSGSATSLNNFENARHDGVLLAVHVAEETVDTALTILQQHSAMDIERTHGQWQQGKWGDFDPTSELALVDPAPELDPTISRRPA